MTKLLPFLFSICVLNAFGQQVPMYNHYLINPFVYNPAMTGASEDINATFARNQRFGSFGQVAVSNYLTADGSLFNDRMGLGMIVYTQNVGAIQQLSSSLSYAYRIKINETSGVRLGLSAGVIDTHVDFSSLNPETVADPYLTSLRPNAPAFNANVGATYYSKNFRAGVAVPQVLSGDIRYKGSSAREYYQLSRHFMLTAEYDIHAGNKLVIRPVVLVRYVPSAPVQYDGSLMAIYNKKIWISATYKSGYAVQANIGVKAFDFLRIGYSYEFLIGSIAGYNPGANHEIFVGISFKNKKEKEIVREEVRVPDPNTVRERDSVAVVNQQLEQRLKELLAEKEEMEERNARERDSLVNTAKMSVQTNPVPVKDTAAVVARKEKLEKIPLAKGYYFKELDQVETPDGFYVIAGVFGSRENADRHLNKVRADFPEARLVVNERNHYFYVLLHNSNDQVAATQVFRKYKKIHSSKVWLLNYQKPTE